MNEESKKRPDIFTGKNAITLNSFVAVSKDNVSVDLSKSGEKIVLHLKNGLYFGLNEVGAKIWNLIQKPRKVSEIRDIILENFEVDPDRCVRELFDILQKMLASGLIEVKNETDT